MEAAAIPLPRPERTPPVTMMYLVGIVKGITRLWNYNFQFEKSIRIDPISQVVKSRRVFI